MGRRLGQHYLATRWPAHALAHAAAIKKGDTVLEIGPGKGALTRVLLEFGAKVIAVEKDETLIEKLRTTFAGEIKTGKLKIIAADIRDITSVELNLKAGKYIVAANIPYYITGEIIRQFLTARNQPRGIVLLVQKEVASRIVSNKESILSLSVKAYGSPRLVKKVPKGNFSPPPSVDSAIIAISNISRYFFNEMPEENFFRVVRAGFASKRKYLSNNLGEKFGKKNATAALSICGIPEKARAEETVLEKWKCLTKQLIASRD